MIFLFLLLFSHLAVAQEFAPGYYVRIGRGYDNLIPFDELITSRPERALHLMKNLQVVSRGISMDDHGARELEAYQLLAQNPGLPWAVDFELARLPELVEDYHKRLDVIRGLSKLPAEWSVRKLVALAQQEVVVKSEKYDLKNIKHLEILILESRDFVDRTNPGLALWALDHMELPDWMDSLDAQVPARMPQADTDHFNHRLRQARWLELNEHRIPEIVGQKWGDLTVMNADIGLGPDNLPLAQDGSQPTRSRESKRPAWTNANHETTDSPDKRFWKVVTAGALVSIGGFLVWLLWRRRMLKAY